MASVVNLAVKVVGAGVGVAVVNHDLLFLLAWQWYGIDHPTT